MTIIKYRMKLLGLLAPVICLLGTACQKKFDPKSYAPVQTFGGYASSSEVAPGDLVAYWSFDGNLMDSVSKTSGTNTGTGFTTGIKGQALQGALNSYVLFDPTSGIKNLQSFTLSYWVNTPQNSNGIIEPVCFVNGAQFWSNLDMFFDGQTATSAVFKIHLFGDGGNKEAWMTGWSLTSPWSVWLHIVLTYDEPSNTFTFYVNGSKVGSSVQSGFGAPNFSNVPKIVFGTIQFQTNPSLTTGTSAQSWASYLTGSLDQVRIYDKALDGNDVKALYQLENLGR